MICNAAAIDWITVTTYDVDVSIDMTTYLQEELEMSERLDGPTAVKYRNNVKVLQYKGSQLSVNGRGSIFLGTGKQRDRVHWMLRASGECSGGVFIALREHIAHDMARVSRIDLQVTVPEPAEWNQVDLFNRMQDAGKNTGFVQSEGETGKLSTVYIGSRNSDRYTRIYQKEADGERYLRYEVEFKGTRAGAIGAKMARKTARSSGVMKHEVVRVRDKMLMSVFLPMLNGSPADRIKVVRVSSLQKKEKWISEQVLPALFNWSNNPDHDAELRLDIIDALGGAE